MTDLSYLDTSAFLKLVVAEEESGALRVALGDEPALVSSTLLTVESGRAALHRGADIVRQVDAALERVTLMTMDHPTLLRAAQLEPAGLRSLDAIHLAAALSLGSELDRFFCYDARLAEAATAHGLDVLAPA